MSEDYIKKIDINILTKYILNNKSSEFSNENFELDILIELFERNNNNHFLILHPPEINIFSDIFNNQNKFDSISKVLKNFDNITVLNYRDSITELKYYNDLAHLNKIGRDKFTQMLISNQKFKDFANK